MKKSIVLLAFCLSSTLALAADRPALPANLELHCDGTVWQTYWTDDKDPVQPSVASLRFIDPTFSPKGGLIPLARTADVEECAYSCTSIPHWEGRQSIDLGYSNSLQIKVGVMSDHFGGDFLMGVPMASVNVRWMHGSNALAVFDFTVEAANKAISIDIPRVINTELARILDKKNTTLIRYLGSAGNEDKLSPAEKNERALGLYKALGDGKGLIEALELTCKIDVPFQVEAP